MFGKRLYPMPRIAVAEAQAVMRRCNGQCDYAHRDAAQLVLAPDVAPLRFAAQAKRRPLQARRMNVLGQKRAVGQRGLVQVSGGTALAKRAC